MVNDGHLARLRQGVEAWNEWREAYQFVRPELAGANLAEAELTGADLTGANLSNANLSNAHLNDADLTKANLSRANLIRATLTGAKLPRADLSEATLHEANLPWADLIEADLSDADLGEACLTDANLTRAILCGARLRRADSGLANLCEADLTGADLTGANLFEGRLIRACLVRARLTVAVLTGADLTGADLTGANLDRAQLVEATIEKASLSGARVYGIAAWGLKGEPKDQNDVVITPYGEPAVTVDDLEVAQFMYLMLHNEKLQRMIDTITSKVVLILGRFTTGRKAVLDAVRTELRERYKYSPVVFDFDKPASKTLTDTVRLLASMARFVIVDLSEATSANYELGVLSQLGLRRTPFVIMAETGLPTMAMLDDVLDMQEVIDEVHRYDSLPHLKATLVDAVLEPAEERWAELNPAAGPDADT